MKLTKTELAQQIDPLELMQFKASCRQPVKNVVVISDLHCGCRMGLHGPWESALDDGGSYRPSKLQLKVWQWWNEFWTDWVPWSCHGEPFAVVVNGDALDGVHHGSTTQVSQNLGDQANIAYRVLAPIVKACEGRYYHIRGTEAHAGKHGVEEERLARMLCAIQAEGQYARHVLWKFVGNGLVNICHHIGTSNSASYESTEVMKQLVAQFTEAGRWNNRPPDIVVRSHRHRQLEVREAGPGGYFTALVTAGWQLKTPFCFRIGGAQNSEPQIGGSIVRQGDRELHTRHWVKTLDRPKTEA